MRIRPSLVLEETRKRAGVETELIDVRSLHMRMDDAGEEMKDPAFSATVERADALILIVPEYNHGYPGLLKHRPRHEPEGVTIPQ